MAQLPIHSLALAFIFAGIALTAGSPFFLNDISEPVLAKGTLSQSEQPKKPTQLCASLAGKPRLVQCAAVVAFELLQEHRHTGECNVTRGKSQRRPVGTSLPRPIKDMRPLPGNIDPSISNGERPTYYWYFRSIYNLALYSPCESNPEVQLINPFAEGWQTRTVVRLTETQKSKGNFTIPFAAVLSNPSATVVVIRGTHTNYEWGLDFNYATIRTPEFPGYVHSGFHAVAQSLLANGLEQAITDLAPANLVITGHSLGAGVATLLSYYFQQALPSARVTAFLFAPPNAGDQAFADAFNQKVNARRVVYSNDVIPTLPCTPTMPDCPQLGVPLPVGEGFEKNRKEYGYVPVSGTVFFGPNDMPLEKETWAQHDGHQDFSVNHGCAYMCYLASAAGDEDNWCLLEPDSGLPGTLCPYVHE